jgi:hypothetical protein
MGQAEAGAADSKGLGNQSACEKEFAGRCESYGSGEEVDGQWEVWDQFRVGGDGKVEKLVVCPVSWGMRCPGGEGGAGEGFAAVCDGDETGNIGGGGMRAGSRKDNGVQGREWVMFGQGSAVGVVPMRRGERGGFAADQEVTRGDDGMGSAVAPGYGSAQICYWGGVGRMEYLEILQRRGIVEDCDYVYGHW